MQRLGVRVGLDIPTSRERYLTLQPNTFVAFQLTDRSRALLEKGITFYLEQITDSPRIERL